MFRPALHLLVLVAAVLAPPAARAIEFTGPDDAQYRACIALTQRQPEQAFESALAWRDGGGGIAARHCAAVALTALKLYPEAAERLEQLAGEMQRRGLPLQAEMLGQAGNAWLLSGETDRAYSAFSSAIAIKPGDPDLLIDRARAMAASSDHAAAVRDLDQALRLEPGRADALAFRASARRQIGDAAGALEDAEAALAAEPEQLEALLERGVLRQSAGNAAGARADWLKVAMLAGGTPVGDAAQAYLERLDLKAQ